MFKCYLIIFKLNNKVSIKELEMVLLVGVCVHACVRGCPHTCVYVCLHVFVYERICVYVDKVIFVNIVAD